MYKETITFTDYNGVERTEDHYFNLTEAETMEMQMSTDGGYTEMINKIVAAKDAPAIMKTFKDFISKSYGVKSDDGRRFIKSPELSEAFFQTEAYNKLIMDLYTNADKAAEFVKAIIPTPKKSNNVAEHPANK